MSDFLNYFFQELNYKKLDYCVWGNYESLPDSLNGSDLDIVVKSRDNKKFYKLLTDAISKFNGKVASYFDTENSRHFRIAGFYEGASWGIMIDVIYNEFFYKEKVYIPCEWVWEFKTIYNEINVNDLGFSYIAGFLKELLHTGKVKDKYLCNAILELKEKPAKYEDFINDVYGVDFFEHLKEEFNKSQAEIDLNFLRKEAQKSIGSSKYGRGINNFKKVDRLFKKAPGFTISVVGTDGSGKSTIIDKITPTLNDAFHNAVYYEHLRPNRFPSIAALFGKEKATSGPVTNPHGSKSSDFFGSSIRWGYYLLDYTIGYYMKIWPKKAIRSCVWIFDRYYYDYLIDPKRSRIKLPKWLLKLGQFIIPEPDIILCLGTDPQVIHKRKPELPLAEVERQVGDLRAFCEDHPRAHWIDTGQDIEESSSEALEFIIQMMAKRFEDIDMED